MNSKVDIGIITIREDEFRAVLAAFPIVADPLIVVGRRHYNMRLADAGMGAQYRIAILRQMEQGNGEALHAARDLIEEFVPRLLLVVGIAGGVPHDDFTLGDVVLSTRIHDYSVEARKEGESPTYALSGGPIDMALAAAIANLPARDAELVEWTQNLPAHPPVDVNNLDLYGPAAWQARVHGSMARHFGAIPRAATYVSGVLATSDRLVKDTSVLISWLETSRHILAVEMESGGVYRAGRDRTAVMAIRGISDIVGLKRDDRWTKHACMAAAAFTRAFLKTTPITPPLECISADDALVNVVATTASLRKAINVVLPNDEDLNEFCLDNFPDVFRRFTGGMERKAKLNLLLQLTKPQEVLDALRHITTAL